MTSNLLRKIPSVDKTKTSKAVSALTETYGEALVSEAVRAALEALRAEIRERGRPLSPMNGWRSRPSPPR